MAQPDFAHLYDQHLERIYRYLLARTGCVEEAEDLTAETFRAALEGYGRYRPAASPPAAWLIGIARHKLADHFRRSRGGLPIDAAEQVPATQPSPEEQAGQRLEMARVSAALRRLNPERAEALALHYFGDLRLADVARAMGKTEEAVKKLVQRGLAELRAQLELHAQLDLHPQPALPPPPEQEPAGRGAAKGAAR